MDNEHFDELIGELSLTADTRLLELAKRDQHRFLGLVEKVLETAIEHGIPEKNLYMTLMNSGANVPRLGHARLPQSVAEKLHGHEFEIHWGPDVDRPAGYYVSIPNYNGGRVIRMADVEAVLNAYPEVLK